MLVTNMPHHPWDVFHKVVIFSFHGVATVLFYQFLCAAWWAKLDKPFKYKATDYHVLWSCQGIMLVCLQLLQIKLLLSCVVVICAPLSQTHITDPLLYGKLPVYWATGSWNICSTTCLSFTELWLCYLLVYQQHNLCKWKAYNKLALTSSKILFWARHISLWPRLHELT